MGKRFIVLVLSFLLLPAALAQSERRLNGSQTTFVPAENIEGRVQFWKLVFTKYGKDELVFHHRSHPEIVYSVLDFTDLKGEYQGRKFEELKEKAVREEMARIQATLRELASGSTPETAFARRLQRIFNQVAGPGLSKYRAASDVTEIRTQTGIRERFMEGVARASRYMPTMEAIFFNAGLPVELARIPLIESSFNYEAYSSKGAAGIWQFMRSTGKLYMRVNASVDERRDPILATRAAAKYLAHSFEKLGSWPLAITSYNHGLNGVMRAVKATGSKDIGIIIREYKGRAFGFASANFYPEFLAALEIEQNWSSYFPGLEREHPVRFEEVRISRAIGYNEVQRHSGLTEEEFARMNQALLQPVRRGRASIPVGFMAKVAPGHGENLVARLGGRGEVVKLASTSEAPTVPKRTPVHGGPVKLKTKPRATETPSKEVRQVSQAEERYRVQKGDTLGSIAKRAGMSTKELMALNNIRNPKKLRAGRELRLSAKPGSAEKGATPKPTETPVAKPEEKPTDIAVESPSPSDPAPPPTHYVVQSGDTLGKIAKKFGMTLPALQKLNPGAQKTIYPGQKIVLQ